MSTTANTGVEFDTTDFDSDGVDAFTQHFLKDAPQEPSEEVRRPRADENEHHETEHEPEDHESASEGEGEGDEEADKRQYAEGDNLFVRIKVGDEQHEVSVKDLQRLYGQEASLTQRSQQLANQRKAVEANEASHLAASNAVLQYARQRWQPYAQIDFLALSRDERISTEQFQALRAEAEDRWNELQFLENQTGQFVQALQARQTETMQTAAKEAVKQITDEAGPHYIPDWSEKTYDSIRSYAINGGLNKDIVNSIVDPAAIKMLHKAMLYDQGASKVQTTKVGQKVTKVVKTSNRMPSEQRRGQPNKKAEDRLRQTGSVDDAAAAFMGRFAATGEYDN